MRPWFAALSALTILVGCGPDRSPDLQQSNQEEKAIVGGSSASAGQFAHQVSIQTRSGFHFCGGSLIGSEWVLTAAHCVVDQTAGGIQVKMGMVNLSSGGDAFGVSQVIVHSGYRASTNQNDVALLRLSRPATGHEPIRLIDFQTEDTYGSPGTFATVTGWGTLSSGGRSPDRLQQVDVPIIGAATCDARYSRENITDQMICAGQGGRDSCQGDSGGPLVVDVPGGLGLIGVVSFGYGCGDARYPGVYARVSEFNAWINNYVPDTTLVGEGTSGGGPTPPATDDHGDDLNTATVLDIPNGDWTLDAQLDGGDTDVFRLELVGSGQLSLNTTGSTDTFATLYDADGVEVASDDDSGEGYNFQIIQGDASGAYYLAVRGYSGETSGAYTLNITAALQGTTDPGPTGPTAPPVTDDHGDEPANATVVTLPAGSIAQATAQLDAGDTDVFEIQMMSAGTLSAWTAGSTDTYGTLTDANGTVLAENDDTDGLQMRVSSSVAAGTYYLHIRGYDGTIAGAYDFSIQAQ